jgi:type I restriction-modification system DNA methylase subunit
MAGADGKLEAQIGTALKAMRGAELRLSALGLLESLGYKSAKTVALDGSVDAFLKLVDPQRNLAGKEDVRLSQWKGVHFLFQLTNDEIPTLAAFTKDMFLSEQDYRASIIESFVFIALELENTPWTRGQLVAITREINRAFPMPAILLFRIGDTLSVSVIDRRQHKRDTSKDVVSKRVSIIKDVSLTEPHRAHVDILADIALQNAKVRNKGTPTNFRDLYDAWIEKLSAQALNKRFYEQLAHWFFWASKLVTFPAAARETDKDKRQEQNQIATIRMLTRLIFVWFIKEKKLVPDALFEPEQLAVLLNQRPDQDRDSSTYYKAILQNLFFATLNTENADERDWRTSAAGKGYDGQYLVHTRYRYKDAFKNPNAALELFRKVPFLNGGLFECLDREVSDQEIGRNDELKKHIVLEGKQKVIRIDGFSDKPQNPLSVPNKIFFAIDEAVDLNAEYATKGKKYTAQGLIELFSRYKFTVEENTPVEEEVALDPELLGKVFENLLASYNPDTKTTARKKSGSFYTPREVVDYMVDEALIAHFSRALDRTEIQDPPRKPVVQALDFGPMPGELDLQRNETTSANKAGVDWRPRLEQLLDYAVKEGNPFADRQTDALISSIDSLRALDPACGSGAYPMGLLQKLIHVLHRLDPDNSRWKQQNRWPYERRLAEAHGIVDSEERDKKIEEEKAALDKLDRDFSNANYADYARKLYLIEKCIYGVDIQPIAVQIAKLRFFISLIVSQKIDEAAPNKNVTALPNLETKLVAANSLIPIERQQQNDLFRNPAIDAKEKELAAMQARYFGARTAKTKRRRRDEINQLRDELADLLTSTHGLPEDDARKMAAWDQFDQNTAAPFFDPEWMFGLTTKFDITIGNPPYVRQEEIKEQKPALEKHYKGNKDAPGCYSGTADLYVYFIQRSIELLNPGGAFAFITSNKWYRAKYGTNLRGWINRQAEIKTIIDFGDADVFDAIAYPTILVATRRAEARAAPAASEALRVMNWPQNLTREDVPEFPDHMKSLHFTMPQKALVADGWQLEPQMRRGLLERIRATGQSLFKFTGARVFRGITTGMNKAFEINAVTRLRLIEDDPNSVHVIKPYVRGANVERWYLEPTDTWIIFTKRGVDIEAYPAIKKHLNKFREQLEPKPENWDESARGLWPGRKAGSYKWFEIQDNVNYWQEFEAPKLLSTKISFKPSFCIDRNGNYPANTAYCIRTGDFANYLAVLLNSNVSEYYSRKTFLGKQGGFYEVQPDGLELFPVPDLSPTERGLMNDIDHSCVVSSNTNFEQLLNGFVYELFFRVDLHAKGLTLFAEAEAAGLRRLQGLEGEALVKAAQAFAASHLTPGARLHTMLQDLQTLDVVRIIEGKE